MSDEFAIQKVKLAIMPLQLNCQFSHVCVSDEIKTCWKMQTKILQMKIKTLLGP